ncbi:hypothetical protein HPP92_012408 [Vanilla planifolia]|uniref:Uncharacterized protein n=1 Tax=Vanilla planifolia TaxID=51239 RepID=A0A835QXH0_VANPL|nr:hypothetical protein HPP92_012408 [Vanilla planifolia]
MGESSPSQSKEGFLLPEEEALILQLHARLGNKWARMAAQLPGRTDNEIKNYWNTRIKRRQRAGLPLYPAEIQRQITLKNQKQGIAMSPACTAQHSLLDTTTFSPPAVALPLVHQNQISSFLQDPTQLKNFLDSSCSFHPPLTTVSPSAATLFPNAAALHAVRDIELSPPLVAQSPAYPEKMELPSTQLFATTGGGIQLPPLSMGQGNCGLLDALLQETQGVGELFKDGLLFEPLPPPTSKSSFMDPLCKLNYSHCSDEILLREEAVQKPVAGIPALLDNTPAQATEVPAETVIHDSCNGDGCELSNGQSSEVTSDDLSLEMQQLASTLAMAHDWSFGSCSWDNMPSIC